MIAVLIDLCVPILLTSPVLSLYSSDAAPSAAPTTATSKPKTLHPPAASAPVCSDPASMKISKSADIKSMPDADIAQLVLQGTMKDHELEKKLDAFRAVDVRRIVMEARLSSLNLTNTLANLPSGPSLDYTRVHGANCEIVVGYVPLPVGIVGPMTLNGESVYVPMATTEGCLVASTQRGAKAISQGSGATAIILRDGITRAPCIRMQSAAEAAALKLWCETPIHFATLKQAFESTTSFGRLNGCNPTVAGRNVYLRLICFSGDAMGMNMVSKGSLAVIDLLRIQFPSLKLVALSGNMCTDKKAAATNWLEGRGKSVVVEATIPEAIVRTTLKTTVKSMVETNLHKCLVGSAMAGTIGGFNAHASNIVTAVFLATGQDPAQNVESSNCITLLEETEQGDLWISCTMPSIEVGTVGGGTSLPAQAACLKAIGVQGGGAVPGENSRKLATVVAAATMAGELSLLAALAANTLVQAHMKHNRKAPTKSK
jgi:hydroxymethylglutaryl-CoA reductase (NADPH)